MLTADNIQPWKSWQKSVFRFLFLFLGFYLLNYELAFMSFWFNFFDSLSKIYVSVAKPLYWLDKHLYHTGYDPQTNQNPPGDNHFGMVFYFTLAILSLIIIVVWGIIDRRKTQYNKLYYWFRIYVRYTVALIMFGYGIAKLIPVQMSYPGVADLLTPIGEQSRFNTVWNFVGASPGYEIFTGACEVTGSLLLLFRRTHVFGSVFMCTILCNVVALNIFYNIPVKLYSSLLLVCVLFLLAPYINKLIQFFFYDRVVSLAEKNYKFERGWKKYLLIALGIGVPAFCFVNDTLHVYKRYLENNVNAKREKLYDVTYFVTKDTLLPILTDTLRWRRFALTNKNSAIIYNMLDKAEYYDCDMDTIKRIYTIHNNSDTANWPVLHYSSPLKNMLQLKGKWKGSDVTVMMKEVPLDSVALNKERITFFRE